MAAATIGSPNINKGARQLDEMPDRVFSESLPAKVISASIHSILSGRFAFSPVSTSITISSFSRLLMVSTIHSLRGMAGRNSFNASAKVQGRLGVSIMYRMMPINRLCAIELKKAVLPSTPMVGYRILARFCKPAILLVSSRSI